MKMEKKKACMIVMNSLITDARVQRAASSIAQDYSLLVIGIGKYEENSLYKQECISLKARKSFERYIEFSYKAIKLLNKCSYSLLYAHDYYTAAIALIIKKKRPNITVVYDAHELIIPEEGKKQTFREKFFYFFEKRAVKCVDLLICASKKRGELMMEHYRLKKLPVVIENISILSVIKDKDCDEIIEKIKSTLNFDIYKILCYAGALTKGRNVGALIDAVESNEKTQLLIVGDGPDYERLKRYAECKIPNRFLFIGSIPYKFLGSILSLCDVGYISYPMTSLNNIYCAPNKVYEYASVELPMIAPYNLTLQEIFCEYDIGVVDDCISNALNIIITNIEYYKAKCREFIEKNPWSNASERLREAVMEHALEQK